ncbi:MAG: ribbon-helix-helix protein, CopG family [Acidimicrobiales bacterium]
MAKTIGFSVADSDIDRLDRLVRKYGHGNRSEFLREAMRQMETIDRAQRLQRLQAVGTARSAAAGYTLDEVNRIVKQVLAQR